MFSIKTITFIVVAIVAVNSALAGGLDQKSKRVESLRTKHTKLFEEINAAFEAKDNAKLGELLDRLEDDLTLSTTNKSINFNRAVLSRDMTGARELANRRLKNSNSAIEKANIHKALGDAYMAVDDLDNALSEYKKIILLSGRPVSNDR